MRRIIIIVAPCGISAALSLLTVAPLIPDAMATDPKSSQPPLIVSDDFDRGGFFEEMRKEQSINLLPFIDWDPKAEIVTRELVNREFARKMQGLMLLTLRERDIPRFPTREAEYWGIRGERVSCILTSLIGLHSPVRVLYFPGSTLCIQTRCAPTPKLADDFQGIEFKQQILDLVREIVRLPYRLVEDLRIEVTVNRLWDSKVYSGKLEIGKPRIDGLGAELESMRDSLFDRVSYTLVETDPPLLGLCFNVPDPDKTLWCREPRVIMNPAAK